MYLVGELKGDVIFGPPFLRLWSAVVSGVP